MTPTSLDTVDGRLQAHGFTITRAGDADHRGGHRWTLHLPEEVGGARFRCRELCWPGVADVPPAELTELVAGLSGGMPLLPLADRGARIEDLDRAAVAGGRRKRLDRDSTLGAVVAASIGDALDRLVGADVGLRLGDDPEFVHQARVATRTLRSDLKTFRPMLDRAWVAVTRSELKWLADALGAVRDLDVLAEGIAAHVIVLGPGRPVGWGSLTTRLAEQHGVARHALVDALRAPRYLDLLRRLDGAVITPPWADDVKPLRPARPLLGRLVGRPWRKLSRAVAALDAEPSDYELHQVRLRAKQVRYASEAAAPVIGKPAKRLAKRTKALQGVLGDHQDAVASQSWLRSVPAEGSPVGSFAAGQCCTLESQRQLSARQAWPRAWDRLDRKRLRRWLS